MAKYTDEQIKKALECCTTLSCDKCEKRTRFKTATYCRDELLGLALDLINRQEAEKAELQRENCELKSKIERVRVEVAELNSNLILLRNDYELCRSGYVEYKAKVAILNDKLITAYKLLKNAKSEAIKEFAERLKKSAFDCDVSFGYGREHYTEAVTVFEIENLVKEMVGEGE